MVGLETLLITGLTFRSEVDGHDFGSEETNIFILTDDRIEPFKKYRPFFRDMTSGAKPESPTDTLMELDITF